MSARESDRKNRPDSGPLNDSPAAEHGHPLYWRLLRLQHVRPNAWQRAVFFEGSLSVAGLLVLADLASLWLLLVLPVAVGLVVKGNDLLAGLIAPARVAADEPVLAPKPEKPAFWATLRGLAGPALVVGLVVFVTTGFGAGSHKTAVFLVYLLVALLAAACFSDLRANGVPRGQAALVAASLAVFLPLGLFLWIRVRRDWERVESASPLTEESAPMAAPASAIAEPADAVDADVVDADVVDAGVVDADAVDEVVPVVRVIAPPAKRARERPGAAAARAQAAARRPRGEKTN